jgi:hypothetical protein
MYLKYRAPPSALLEHVSNNVLSEIKRLLVELLI